MTIVEKTKALIKKALTSGATPKNLAFSFCMGLYIAFSPFPGCHTFMMFGAKYLFNLHFPTLFFATSLNNPWTIIPFFSCDYAFGYWLIHSLLGIEPSWAISLEKLFGTGKICVWSFLVGGNILGIASAIICWPIIKKIFSYFAQQQQQTDPTIRTNIDQEPQHKYNSTTTKPLP